MLARLFRSKPPEEGKLRGYKLTTVERTRKIGVAASSLKILKKKAAEKLKVSFVRFFQLILENN